VTDIGSWQPDDLLGLDHVGLAVPDLDAALAWHLDVLGLILLHREENRDADVVEAMLGPAGGASADGPGRGGTQVQLVAPLSPDSAIARFLQRSRPGLHHLAYRVADVEPVAARLRGQGCRLLYDRARPGTRGSRINFVHPQDTGGVLIELVQAAETIS